MKLIKTMLAGMVLLVFAAGQEQTDGGPPPPPPCVLPPRLPQTSKVLVPEFGWTRPPVAPQCLHHVQWDKFLRHPQTLQAHIVPPEEVPPYCHPMDGRLWKVRELEVKDLWPKLGGRGPHPKSPGDLFRAEMALSQNGLSQGNVEVIWGPLGLLRPTPSGPLGPPMACCVPG